MTDDGIRLFPEIGQPTWLELIVAMPGAMRRELADPSLHPDVRSLLRAHSVDLSARLFRREWSGGRLRELQVLDPTTTGMTVVAVYPGISVQRLQERLQRSPHILPSRMVWPT